MTDALAQEHNIIVNHKRIRRLMRKLSLEKVNFLIFRFPFI